MPITIPQKIEICIEKNKDPNIKNNQFASKYNVSESTVSEILKKSDYFLSLNPNQFTAKKWIKEILNPKILNLLSRLSELIYDSINNFGL